jgi:uncharacterized protein (TIGR03437 family)
MVTLHRPTRSILLAVLAIFLSAGAAFTQDNATFDDISRAINAAVSHPVARGMCLCHFRAALWGQYDASAVVGGNLTVDRLSRTFRLTAGRFQTDTGTADGSSTVKTMKYGSSNIPSAEVAFQRGVPFFLMDVGFETPRSLQWTVLSNPAVNVTGAYPMWSYSGGTVLSAFQLDVSSGGISSKPAAQKFTWKDDGHSSYPAGVGTLSLITQSRSGSNFWNCAESNEVVVSSLPVIADGGAVNAASHLGGPVAPGEIVSVSGHRIGPNSLAAVTMGTDGKIMNALASTRVLFDGVPAPLLFVRGDLLNAVVPYAVGGKTTTNVAVEYAGQTSASLSLAVAATAVGVFTADASGRGQAAVLNQDGSVNSEANPAARNSVVSIYATGEGQTIPDGIDGQPAGQPLPQPRLPVSVKIAGIDANVEYAGGAQGLIAGVIQIKARVPAAAAAGTAVPLVVSVGDSASQPGVSIAIR